MTIVWGRVVLRLGLLVALAFLAIVVLGRPASTSPADAQAAKGSITFGRAYDPETLEITSPATTFKDGEEIAWSARLLEPAGAQTLTFIVAKQTAAGVESGSSAYKHEMPVSNPDAQVFANKLDLSAALDGPGLYVMRYLRGGTRLASGTFTVEP